MHNHKTSAPAHSSKHYYAKHTYLRACNYGEKKYRPVFAECNEPRKKNDKRQLCDPRLWCARARARAITSRAGPASGGWTRAQREDPASSPLAPPDARVICRICMPAPAAFVSASPRRSRWWLSCISLLCQRRDSPCGPTQMCKGKDIEAECRITLNK